MDTRKLRAAFYEKEIQRVVKTDDVFKIEKSLVYEESAKVSRNILSSGRAIRKNSIRGIGESDLTTSI